MTSIKYIPAFVKARHHIRHHLEIDNANSVLKHGVLCVYWVFWYHQFPDNYIDAPLSLHNYLLIKYNVFVVCSYLLACPVDWPKWLAY